MATPRRLPVSIGIVVGVLQNPHLDPEGDALLSTLRIPNHFPDRYIETPADSFQRRESCRFFLGRSTTRAPDFRYAAYSALADRHLEGIRNATQGSRPVKSADSDTAELLSAPGVVLPILAKPRIRARSAEPSRSSLERDFRLARPLHSSLGYPLLDRKDGPPRSHHP